MKHPRLLSGLSTAILAIALGAIWGCSSLRPDIGSPDPSTFAIRLRTGTDILCIDNPSWTPDETMLLAKWASDLGKGGHVSFNSYAPGLVVSGDDFTANFLGGYLVLNARSASGHNWTQLVRKQTELDAAVFSIAKAKFADLEKRGQTRMPVS